MTILKEYRIDNRLKQKHMAEKLNCSIQSYRLYENGEKEIPNRVLLKFLRLRGTEDDLIVADALEELYEN